MFFDQPPIPIDTDWAEDEIQYTRLLKVQDLLKELTREIEFAEAEDSLNLLLEDSTVVEQFLRISALVSCITTNVNLNTISTSIKDIHTLIKTLSDKIDQPTNPDNKTKLCVQNPRLIHVCP